MPEVIKEIRQKILLAFMLILLVTAILFNFKVNLVYHKNGSGSVNIIDYCSHNYQKYWLIDR